MRFWETVFVHVLLLISILLQSTVASIELQGRKHSTVHSFPNGTIYVLGGISNATKSQLSSPNLTLRVDIKDFSLHSIHSPSNNTTFPPTTGHTSHIHVPSNSIISCFGLQQHNKASPPIIPSPSSSFNKTIPLGRHQHTSALINNHLYIIGGKQVTTNALIEAQDMIWAYSFLNNSWSRIQSTTESMTGHSTVVYNNRWLISCFGQQHRELTNDCTWFDTISFNYKKITPSSITEWPNARLYASMISLPNNEYILFGGENKNSTIFDDVWKLKVNSSSFTMNWKKVDYKRINGYDYRRSGHASTLIAENNIILYYGGQNDPHSITVSDPIYLDISKMEWIETKNMKSDHVGITNRNGVELGDTNGKSILEEKHGLSGGAIGGIVISIIGVCAVGIGFFVWKKRHSRQRNIHNKSRAARFSQSPTPMFKVKQREIEHEKSHHEGNNHQGDLEKDGSKLQGLANTNFLSLPELALNNHSRISTISLGAEFCFHPDDYRRQSHQSLKSAFSGERDVMSNLGLQHNESIAPHNNSDSSFNRQQLESLSEEDHGSMPANNYKRRESTGFKRLTLNLFSSSSNDQAANKKKDRSSSLFQLRSSKLLQPSTPATPDGRYPYPPGKGSQSRASLGAKSVSSIQWVGFNDNMDLKGNNWRGSSASSMHLAVKNARASSYYTSDSSQSTPRSPMFPHHLRDSTSQYHINEMEASSWKTGVNKE
ncbi:unnamed protein product [Mucor hiemalis]